jgi:hypothetical protein
VSVDLEDLRAHAGTGPSDEDLQTALVAALEALDERYGPEAPTVTEYLRPFGQWVKLGRRAAGLSSVKEGGTAVADEDRTIWPGGRFLRRLSGDEPAAWTGMVEVEYSPLSESAQRDRIAYALCDLELSRVFGLRGITVGPWSEMYPASADDASYADTRTMILDSLRPARMGVW